MVSPLLVSFGTGLLKRYNQRKQAKSAADYEMALNEQEKIWEMQKLVEDRNHQYNLADYKHQQSLANTNLQHLNEIELAKMEQGWDSQDAQQDHINKLALENLKNTNAIKLETHKDTLASASNALAVASGFEVFGQGQSSFKLNQYVDNNNNPKVGPEWDAKKMEDLNESWSIPGFKDIVLSLPDSELQRFQTYATQLFNKYRVSNASKADTGEFLAWARIKPNKQGKGAFQNLFDTEKFPDVLGMETSYEDSTNYIKALTFQEAKKKNKNITNAFTKESEDGLYDFILTQDDITKLYPDMPLDDIMALAEITKAYNPELHQPGTTGIEANLEVIYNLKDRPQDLLAVKHANEFATTGRMSAGNELVAFWNANEEVYGPSDGYTTLSDGSKRYVGINHEARLESLALGVLPVLTDDSDPMFVNILDASKVDEAQKRIVAPSDTMLADIKNVGQQGTTTLDLIRNILTTYDPSYGGSPFVGGTLDLMVLLEGFTAQAGLLPQTFGANEANTILQKIYIDNKLKAKARQAISTFELDGTSYNITDHINNKMDKRLQVAAQRKFFATALNYTVSMILQGGTGGKTISDTDYEIMDRAMYNGLFTSQGLNLSALEAIYKTIELPITLAQYKTDLSNPNAIQNMQAAMMYERLLQFNGKKEYFKLRNMLMGYSEPTVQVSMQKDDYFNGLAYQGQYTPGATPTREKTEDGKNIVYFNYFKGGDKATSMPMKLEDVEKYFPRFYDTVKENYADFDDPVFDTYKTHFQENDIQDSSNIVKDNWNLLGGLVDDDATPDSTLQ